MKSTLTNEQLIEKAKQWIKDLCESGGHKWCLRVPADHNHDPDLIFSELCNRLEEYAQQSQPSGMWWVMDEIAFLEECVRITKEGDWSTIFVKPMQDRIAKLKDFLSESSPAGAAEGASEGMAGAVKFAKFLADNDYRPGSGNKHWFKWNGMEVDETPLTLEQVYQIFASLSPGVEDNQTKKQ